MSGARRPRTRLPKQGEYRIEALLGYSGDFLRSPTKHFVYSPRNIMPSWRNPRDVEIVGITRSLDNRLPIESVSGQTRTVIFDRPSLFALLSGTDPGPYWAEKSLKRLKLPASGISIVRAESCTTFFDYAERFAVGPSSPAARIGFEPWDFSAVGVRPGSGAAK